jgi:hypothetical protein
MFSNDQIKPDTGSGVKTLAVYVIITNNRHSNAEHQHN